MNFLSFRELKNTPVLVAAQTTIAAANRERARKQPFEGKSERTGVRCYRIFCWNMVRLVLRGKPIQSRIMWGGTHVPVGGTHGAFLHNHTNTLGYFP
jgi:hypothetical protein